MEPCNYHAINNLFRSVGGLVWCIDVSGGSVLMSYTDIFGMVVFITVVIMGITGVLIPLYREYKQKKEV